ncbi:MAG: bifunctional diaminohydroxyphosphoribosylaminopyrimidine deaminase/5-amino-6-(5-phosphoribosylamino)uracil reductase RibD, partial [Candidatus Micrarchaeota archaeon]
MDRFMALAIRLARKADPYPNPRVGAVLVKGGRVIGTGYHRKPGLPHAEIAAMDDARARSGDPRAPEGATLYVTMEPCSHRMKRTPPCTGAIAAAGISKVVYGMRDPNPLVSGAKELWGAGVAVQGPVAEGECRAFNSRYLRHIQRKPLVSLKMAMSADGKTATRTGDSQWISCPESRRFSHRLRREHDAVMVGAGTVIADDPRLTARLGGGPSPIRVIVDGKLRMPLSAKVLHNPDCKTIVATTESAPPEKVGRLVRETQAHVFVEGKGSVDLRRLADALGAMGMKKILIEGGSTLAASAMDAGIIDKVYLVIAPLIIGGEGAKCVIGGKGIGKLKDALKLK